jgi:hypothetical protein
VAPALLAHLDEAVFEADLGIAQCSIVTRFPVGMSKAIGATIRNWLFGMRP